MLTEVRGQTLTFHDCRLEVNLSCCSVYFIFSRIQFGLEQIQTDSIVFIRQTHFFCLLPTVPCSRASSLKENASKTLAWDPSASLCLCQVIKTFNFTVFLVRICFLISEKSISLFVTKKYRSVLIVT